MSHRLGSRDCLGDLKVLPGPSFLVPSPHSRKPRWISFLRLVIRNVCGLIAPLEPQCLTARHHIGDQNGIGNASGLSFLCSGQSVAAKKPLKFLSKPLSQS